VTALAWSGDVVPIAPFPPRKGSSLNAPDQKPLVSAPGLSQSKWGRTSAPRLPHVVAAV
jgi:hypothetical protein